ncbi:hypothetical protein Tco_1315562 [Tanacetum coccineum]
MRGRVLRKEGEGVEVVEEIRRRIEIEEGEYRNRGHRRENKGEEVERREEVEERKKERGAGIEKKSKVDKRGVNKGEERRVGKVEGRESREEREGRG